jgi:antitoxin (DNA-binding transcriptional repressor) of toxin-antitoxin stability system
MKIESIGDAKARLSRLISELPKTGSVVTTKNGKACAALMLITDDTDLETLALSQNKRFCRMFDTAYERAEKKGWIDIKDLD